MKALIIDDEPLIRRSLARALSSRGHEILESSDGISGLELWTKALPDLAFVDVLMPGLTGPQLIQALPKEVREKTKIIMMSAYTGSEGTSPKLSDGVEMFLSKPFEDIFSIVTAAEELMKNGKKK